MNFSTARAAIIGIVLLLAAGSRAAAVVVASHTYPPNGNSHFGTGAGMGTDNGLVFDNRRAQTFTAAAGGVLDDVSFIATRSSDTTADLRVSIATLSNGQPATVLGSQYLPAGSFAIGFTVDPKHFTHVADFAAQNIVLAPQGVYVIVFSTDQVEGSYQLFGGYDYADGQLLRSQNGSAYTLSSSGDLFFQVTVVPEPAAALTVVTALLSLAGRRRRRQLALTV